jgi:hypothetical protein
MSKLDRTPERPGGAQPPHAWAPPTGAPHPLAPPPGAPPPPPAGAPPATMPPAPGGEPPPRLAGRSALAALAAGLLAAAALPGNSIGLGVVLVALGVALAAALAPRERFDPWSPVWAGLALALTATAFLRDAEWVVLPALGTAIGFGSLAVAGGRTWAGVGRGLVTALGRLPYGPVAVTGAMARVLPGDRGRLAPAFRGAALAVALVVVFGLLFASGDAAFAQLADDALPAVDDFGSVPVRVLWLVAAVALAGALATTRKPPDVPPATSTRRAGPAEWATALVALDLLFAAFVAVQATVLFGRDDHVLRTAGLTYAEYAREGFAELLVAAVLTLAVVAGALRWARAATPGQRHLLRALLAVLCALTLVVLASALHRLDLYQDAFGATRLRLAAEATALWLAAILSLVLVGVALGRHAWVPRASALAGGSAVLVFALSSPDHRIAERNAERYAETGLIDVEYLRHLSADAVPALAELPADVRSQALVDQRRELAAGDGWAELNRARKRARHALEEASP